MLIGGKILVKTAIIVVLEEGKLMLCDYHIHTEFSFDCNCLMEDIIKMAIEKGLEEICFTDHVDYGIKKDVDDPDFIEGKDDSNVNYPLYFQKIEYLKKKYYQNITIKRGLEFGVQVHTIDQFKQLYDRYDLDFIILSINQLENQELFKHNLDKKYSALRYYQELLEVIKKYHDYSVIGHFDLIKKCCQDEYSISKYQDIIADILKQLIIDNKGIEVNLSSLKQEGIYLVPSIKILKMYHDLGGKIITIGSNSYEMNQVGKYIEEMKMELKKIGFKHFCTFKQMQPIFHLL